MNRRRDIILTYRVDEGTREQIKRRARDAGYPTVSAYLRDLVRRDVHPGGYRETKTPLSVA